MSSKHRILPVILVALVLWPSVFAMGQGTVIRQYQRGQVHVSATVDHITSVLHIAAATPIPVVQSPQGALWFVSAHQSGVWTIAHISSALHIANTAFANALATRCVNTAGTAFEACGGGSGSGDAVNVFHQSTIRHISSVTHVGGTLSLVNQAGTYATFTGTTLDVTCTGCAAASTVSANQMGTWTIQATHQAGIWRIDHITSVVHIAAAGPVPIVISPQAGVIAVTSHVGTGSRFVNQSGSWTVQAAHQAGVWRIDHVTSVTHIAAASPLPVVQSPQQGPWPVIAHQGGASWTVSQGPAGNFLWPLAAHQAGIWNIAHVTSVTHVAGAVMVRNQAGTLVTVTGTSLDVNCTGCSAASVVNVAHVSAVTHVAAASPLPVVQSPQGGIWNVTAHAGTGSLTVNQGGVFTVQAAHQGGAWAVNIAHISATVHLAGSVTDNANSALRVTAVTLVQANVGHISSALHVVTSSGSPLHIVASTGSGNLVCHSTAAIATSANGIVIHASLATNRIFICGIVLVASAASTVSIVEGTGAACVTGITPMIGSTVAANGLALAANGGFVHTASFPWIATATAGNNVCLLLSAGRVSGTITYRGNP